MNTRRRILLVEDDTQLGHGLHIGLAAEGYEVVWVTDARGAEASLESESYDLLLLDLQLPDKSGMTLLKQLRSQGRDDLVLVATARNDIEDRIAGLDLGADDYLVKPFDFHELTARIRALLRRRYAALGCDARFGELTLNAGARVVGYQGRCQELPRREFSVLQLLLESAGRELSRSVIESHIYSIDDDIASNTLEVHIHNLRKRFGADLIRTIRGVGYVIDHPGD